MPLKKNILFMICMTAGAIFAAGLAYSNSSNDQEAFEFEADLLVHDEEHNAIYAKGNAYINQNNQYIFADEILYSMDNRKIYAKGNVAFENERGHLFFAQEVVFDKGEYNGVALDFQAKITKSRLVAKLAEIQHKEIMTLEDFTYSPCSICKDDTKPNFPLWQIRADTGKLDRSSDQLTFTHAKIDVFGKPIFYTPYFSAPAPGAKRRSGFLMIKNNVNSVLGSSIKAPYYFNLAPNYDLLYSPEFFSKNMIIHHADFRHLLKSGSYRLKASFLNQDLIDRRGKKVSTPVKDKKMHYSLVGHYIFDSSSALEGYLDFTSTRVHDKSKEHLKKFKIHNGDYLTTDVHFMNYNNQSHYYSLRTLQFQDLRTGYNAKTTPLIFPMLDGRVEKKTDFLNASFFAEYNILNLHRAQGTSYNRVSLKPGAHIPFSAKHGSRGHVNLFVRTDFYKITKKPIQVNVLKADSFRGGEIGSESRITPEISSEWSLPFYKYVNGSSIIIEPVITSAYSSYKSNLHKVSNEDSLDPEINAGNLLSINKFSGFDRLETGPRANIGMRTSISSQYFDNANFFIGQAFRKKQDKNFNATSGLHKRSSDYVGKFTLIPNQNILITDNIRFKRNIKSIQKNELSINVTNAKYNGSLTHAFSKRDKLESLNKRFRQEYIANGEYNFYQSWWVIGNVHGNLGRLSTGEKNKLISDGAGLKYLGDCLTFDFNLKRDYIKTKSIKPSTTLTWSISVPTF